jgi:hypothetical protein
MKEGMEHSFEVQGHAESRGDVLSYRLPEAYRVNDLEISTEELRALTLQGLQADPFIRSLSGESRGELGETLAGIAETAHIASTPDFLPEASRSAKAATVANAFFATPEDEETVDAALGVQMEEAKAEVAKEDGESKFVNWVNTKGKSVVRALVVAASLSAVPQMASAGGRDFGGLFERAVVQRVESGVRVKRTIENINARQERIRIDIERLEREKEIHMQRVEGRMGVMEVRGSTNTQAQLVQLESRFKAGKMILEAERARLETLYTAKPNPSAKETADYHANMTRIEAQIVRLDGDYEAQRIRLGGGEAVRGGRIGNEMVNADARVQRIDIEIDRKVAELRRLEIEKSNVLLEGGFRVFRR